MKDLYQSGDWKAEKHVPSISAPDAVKAGEPVELKIKVGEEIAHPNTTAHHITWIAVYFHPEGEKFPVEIGRFEFNAHGASAKGPDTSTILTEPEVRLCFKTGKPGMILAASFCNIHGLWENAKALAIL
ncbi:MAG: class II SORL domain-containing protein [Candidatus Omnitrophica bacterium]|nr:class II SORL domain-containing protein [Candidatus Omnitrophota bacterium]